MFRVKDYMTKHPVCIDPDEKISAVLDLMRAKKIHRLPVVNADRQLVGLVTEGMIMSDKSATSLSIYELNYLLSKTEASTVMIRHPYSIEENELMEKATEIMLHQDIGCLPVVNENNQVVGILTQNDIFKAFLNMLGWNRSGTRLLLEVPEAVGQLEKISALFTAHNISIANVVVYESTDEGSRVLVKTNGLAPESLKDDLDSAGFKVEEWSEF